MWTLNRLFQGIEAEKEKKDGIGVMEGVWHSPGGGEGLEDDI